MMRDDQRLLEAILRNDFGAFTEKVFQHVSPTQVLQRTWHMRALAFRLEQCIRGDIRRLIITIPPRHMKSIFASVSLPAFILGRDPTARIICASYSADLSAKLARDSRSVMTSRWYRQVFSGTQLSLERNAESDFQTTKRGFRLATSIGGSLTGRGGNWVILDDPMKAEDAQSAARRASSTAWFDNTLYTRLDNKSTDVIIVIMQRLHIDDMVGHILAKGESWVHLDLPAIAEIDEQIQIGPSEFHFRRAGDLLSPIREPIAVLDDMRRSLGSFNFSAQYQQRAIPAEGEIIKWGWFQFYDTAPRPGVVMQSWDTAQKDGELNDYSVCTTWVVDAGGFYMIDLFRQRLLYPELRRAVIEQRQRYNAVTVLIEDKGSGTSLIQDLRSSGFPGNLISIVPEGDKTLRASSNSIPIEAGRVFLPRQAAWLSELRKEIQQFPEGRFDDQVDSLTQFVGWMDSRLRMPGVRKVALSGI